MHEDYPQNICKLRKMTSWVSKFKSLKQDMLKLSIKTGQEVLFLPPLKNGTSTLFECFTPKTSWFWWNWAHLHKFFSLFHEPIVLLSPKTGKISQKLTKLWMFKSAFFLKICYFWISYSGTRTLFKSWFWRN